MKDSDCLIFLDFLGSLGGTLWKNKQKKKAAVSSFMASFGNM